MINPKLLNYLEETVPARSPFFEVMEEYAKMKSVPIMDFHSMEILLQLLRIKRPARILEIGAAIGYSALRMAEATNAKVVTIERDLERIQKAKEYIHNSDKSEQVILIEGDALEVADEVKFHAPFDCLFIDAAKGQYKRFFDLYSPMLASDGIVITDNVLFKGHVYDNQSDNKRLKKLGEKINTYNQWLLSLPSFHTVILPVGDGIAITVKKSD